MTVLRAVRRCGLLAALLFATAGCTGVAETVVGSAALALVDKAVSNYVGVECRMANLLTTGSICKTAAATRVTAPVYCYRTLGTVDCYPETDPFAAPSLPGLERPPAVTLPPPSPDVDHAPPAPIVDKSASPPPPQAELSYPK